MAKYISQTTIITPRIAVDLIARSTGNHSGKSLGNSTYKGDVGSTWIYIARYKYPITNIIGINKKAIK
mgnify:CR=1 FL=1